MLEIHEHETTCNPNPETIFLTFQCCSVSAFFGLKECVVPASSRFKGEMLTSCLQQEVCRVRVQSWLNMLAYLVNLGITYGSLTGAFGATNEELSEKYQTLVTPAGYAFAIWGAIFTWEGIFAVAQMFPSLSTSPVVDTITPWWIFASCFQFQDPWFACWEFCWVCSPVSCAQTTSLRSP